MTCTSQRSSTKTGGEVLEPGERGELVVTPLVKEAMPLLRYRTGGDITMILEEECPCGRGMKIARLHGRSDDMLVIRGGINVFPSQIEHVLRSVPEVGDEFLVYVDRVNHLDEMTIEVEMDRSAFKGELEDLTRVQNRVVAALKEALNLRTACTWLNPIPCPPGMRGGRPSGSLTGGGVMHCDRLGPEYGAQIGGRTEADAVQAFEDAGLPALLVLEFLP